MFRPQNILALCFIYFIGKKPNNNFFITLIKFLSILILIIKKKIKNDYLRKNLISFI